MMTGISIYDFSKTITFASHHPEHKMAVIKDAVGRNEYKEAAIIPEHTATANKVDDKDYLPSKFNIPGHYNYLDPNYMPSSTATS